MEQMIDTDKFFENLKRLYIGRFQNLTSKPLMSQLDLFQAQKYVIICLYEWRTLRNDFRSLKFRNYVVNEDNYIVSDNDNTKIYINNFKTNDCVEYIIEETLPVHISNSIDKLLCHRNKFHGDHLFVREKATTIHDSSSWSALLKTIFHVNGKPLGSRGLRHLVATWINRDVPSSKEMFERARKMQHSTSTQLYVYRDE